MMQEDKKIKISVYENRIVVNIHPYNPFFNDEYVSSLPPTPQKVIKRDQPFMSKRQEAKNLKRSRKKLFNVCLDYDKCVFMTLGTSGEMAWDNLLAEFNKFLANARYKYGSFKIIRKVECYCNGFNRFHIHLILIFDNARPTISRNWLEKHWVHGKVHFEYLWKNREYGVLEYITLVKPENFHPTNRLFTKYPANAKIIGYSPELVKDRPIYEREISIEQYNAIINEAKKCSGKIFYDGHYYDKDKYCLDRVYLHDIDDLLDKM